MSDLIGRTIGRYRLESLLGRGGMAEVYKAYQASLDRYVAIKILHAHLSDDEGFLQRFEREAAAVARLRHPKIIQVYDFESEGELHYIVMEYIDGPTLRTSIVQRNEGGEPFTLKATSIVIGAVAEAIGYAHRQGVIHRDLKPANIMFTAEGNVVLTDFGVASLVDATWYTATGTIGGTPAYMSPEQGEGERGDPRSDIYSLGVILYEMVTARVPFEADTPLGVIRKHVEQPVPPIRKDKPSIPEVVEEVILTAMNKKPEERYQTAEEMASALKQSAAIPGVGEATAEAASHGRDTETGGEILSEIFQGRSRPVSDRGYAHALNEALRGRDITSRSRWRKALIGALGTGCDPGPHSSGKKSDISR